MEPACSHPAATAEVTARAVAATDTLEAAVHAVENRKLEGLDPVAAGSRLAGGLPMEPDGMAALDPCAAAGHAAADNDAEAAQGACLASL
jgi:hypothetical protein